ncbi:hypothetical protein GK047_02275 [Paenibacillus sp. SYP-B3998]|uniref:Uncharacterized protein n=1 Tax=Paenibacillus sp. SYP-B3998 TaxID=2678564 RepID=A0A6G3ZRV0_9BACL|nr:hypothetical protein [Paenibacillus sp. SYP-B3998]NEW04845.1 hypothetical protein [Paenibacillus sp. SYP-B3998]
MITCEQCGKTNGHGVIGTNWVCGDCKMGEGESRELELNVDDGITVDKKSE